MSVKRWKETESWGFTEWDCMAVMEECADGDYVLHSDYAALLARCEELNELANDPYRLSKGWRPIETAPKDEEILLAFRTWKEEPLGRGLGYFDAITEHWRLQDGSRLEGYLTPTHWMPLPKPPSV